MYCVTLYTKRYIAQVTNTSQELHVQVHMQWLLYWSLLNMYMHTGIRDIFCQREKMMGGVLISHIYFITKFQHSRGGGGGGDILVSPHL